MGPTTATTLTLVMLGAGPAAAEPTGAPAAEPDAAPTTEAAPAAEPEGTGEPGASASLEGSAKLGGAAKPETSAQSDVTLGAPPKEKWIRRLAPERHMGEIGVYGGINILSTRHELFEKDLSDRMFQGWKLLDRFVPDVGLRAGYYPLPFLGFEVDGAIMPTRVSDNDERALLWTARGHVVGQLGLWSVTPFVLFGGGVLGVSSDATAVGNDVDPVLHWGGGLKFYVHRFIQVRLETRDNISSKQGLETGMTNHWEILAGLTVTLGRKKQPKPAPEPEAPPPEPEPTPASDRDGDGIEDPRDRCPDEPGVEPDGCPLPDRDGDGWLDDVDKCPDEAGGEPDGCPAPGDQDGDGLADDVDKCPTDPETKNGFEDEDGCPDEVPKEVERFEGALQGVNFANNKDTLMPGAGTVLDQAVAALKKYPEIRVEISGHTDSTGNDAYNLDLSRRRAEAVKRYLVDKGVAADRIETRGAGPHEPIDSNVTVDGRAKNRRIEFKVLQ